MLIKRKKKFQIAFAHTFRVTIIPGSEFLPLVGCCAVIETFLELCSVRNDLVDNEPYSIKHVGVCTQATTKFKARQLPLRSSSASAGLYAAPHD